MGEKSAFQRFSKGIGHAWAETTDLFLPTTCACCGTYGDGLAGRKDLCPRCNFLLRNSLLNVHLAKLRTEKPICYSSGLYEHEVASAVLAFKNGGRTDLTDYLASGLLRALSALLEKNGGGKLSNRPLVLVPMPSEAASIHRRGFSPADELAQVCARKLRSNLPAGVAKELLNTPIKVVPALKKRRQPPLQLMGGAQGSGQKTLGVTERFRRMRNTLEIAQPPGRFLGFRYDLSAANCVLIDDVVTTGATLAAAESLLSQHTRVLGAATVASVPRRDNNRQRTT